MIAAAAPQLVLSLAQVAEFFGVSTKTVYRWTRDKKLRAFYLPGRLSSRRACRVYALDVHRFAVQEGLPTQALERWLQDHGALADRCPAVLVAGPTLSLVEALSRGHFDASHAPRLWQAGNVFGGRRFAAVVLDGLLGSSDVEDFADWARSCAPETALAVIAGEDAGSRLKGWKASPLFDLVWQHPICPTRLANELWQWLNSSKAA